MSGIYSRRKITAVDREALACDKACPVRGEQDGRTHNFSRIAESVHWRAKQNLASPVGAVQQMRVQFRREDAGRDSIHTNAV